MICESQKARILSGMFGVDVVVIRNVIVVGVVVADVLYLVRISIIAVFLLLQQE